MLMLKEVRRNNYNTAANEVYPTTNIKYEKVCRLIQQEEQQ
jgi:hypothetical protein